MPQPECPPENAQPCKTLSIIILYLMPYRKCTWGTGELCYGTWGAQGCSGDDGSRGFPGGMSSRQPSLTQQAYVGRCLWICKTSTGNGGPLAQVLKAGCSSLLTDPWKFETSVMSERSSSTVGTDGKEWAWPPKEDFLLPRYYCGQIEAVESAALGKLPALCCQEC